MATLKAVKSVRPRDVQCDQIWPAAAAPFARILAAAHLEKPGFSTVLLKLDLASPAHADVLISRLVMPAAKLRSSRGSLTAHNTVRRLQIASRSMNRRPARRRESRDDRAAATPYAGPA